MDDIYHGYNCGDDCPICYPFPKVTVRLGRRVFFPHIKAYITAERAGDDQVRIIVEPPDLTLKVDSG